MYIEDEEINMWRIIFRRYKNCTGMKNTRWSQGRRSYLNQAIQGIGIDIINDKIKFHKR